MKPAWPSCAHGFRGSPQPADNAAPGRGPCLHAHHTERSAGLSRSSDGFLFLSLCSACLGCVPLSNTWLGSLGGRVPPGVSVPALTCRAPGREPVLARGQVARRALHAPAGGCAVTFLAPYSGQLQKGSWFQRKRVTSGRRMPQVPWLRGLFPQWCSQESARAYQRRQERNVCLLHASAFPPASGACLTPKSQPPTCHTPGPRHAPPRLLSCRGVWCRTTRSPWRDRASEICFLPCRPRSTQT